jgi:voltage-gated potassium channel
MRNAIRDILIVVRSIWPNMALFAGLIIGASVFMLFTGCFPGKTFGELMVKAFYMSRIEGAMDGCGQYTLTALLVFIMPVLTVFILGEGVLRVAGLYLNRKRHKGEWEKLMITSLSGHIVLCGAGELGCALLNQLHDKSPDLPVVVIDIRPDVIAELIQKSSNIHGITGNMTSRETLLEANVATASKLIITSGNDAHNLETVYKVLEINPSTEMHIRLYHSALSQMMNTTTYPNIHFFSPYESAAESLLKEIGIVGK